MSEHNRGYSQALSYCKAISLLFDEILKSGRPADRELKTYFRAHRECGSRDRRFITEALYGFFRWYGWLKPLLPLEYLPQPLESKEFCKALTLALWLESRVDSQAYGVVSEIAEFDLPELGSIQENQLVLSGVLGRELTLASLLPSWFELSEAQIIALQQRPPVWIRVKALKMQEVCTELKSNDVVFEKSKKVFGAIKLLSRVNVNELQTYRHGCFEIQDLASQCLALSCGVEEGQNWWDVCAGGGGKTLALREEIGTMGSVTATDKRDWILKEVKKRSDRARYTNIRITALTSVEKQKNGFDGVLVDAPCSCTGTWRRNPDARWLADSNICQDAAKLQLEILTKASIKVKLGGSLVYATCSMSPLENEQLVEEFLEDNKDFSLVPFLHPLTAEKTSGMMSIDSMPEDCDSMFAAKMIRS
jgi:16S rRNA (cytosine967-C5)-methyltransferase